jgi:V8-like Glu-specific endopeptidase
MNLKFLVTLLILLFLRYAGNAQLSFGGSPASFGIQKKSMLTVPIIDMVPVDNNQLIKEEINNPNRLKSLRFAKSFSVDLDPSHVGQWITNSDMKIWQVSLRSKGAWSLNLIFDKLMMPEGASLFIYNPDHSKVLGAFTSNSEQSSGQFATYPLAGDQIILEYNEPKLATYQGELHISAVNHDYKNIFGTRPLGEAGLCNLDVYCPEASNYTTEKQAVVCMIVNGNTLCTGTLLNNTKQDKTPYLLTAGHCIENNADAQHTIFCFNYESPICGYNRSSINGFSDQTLSGAFLKARSDSLDFSLLQLETAPPATFRPFFAGWDRSTSITLPAASITHPEGDVKKITKTISSIKAGSFNSQYKSNSFWIISQWQYGSTEGGSSGGALMNQKKYVVGTLTGGASTCADPINDLFSMFYKQWDYYKTSDKQLKFWLDPNNSGVTELAGLDGYSASNSCSLFTNAIVGERDTIKKVSTRYSGYISGTNQLRISSYAERFTQTQLTHLSSISLGVAKLAYVTLNQNSKITVKIYDESTTSGLPGNELTSMDIPYSLISAKKMNFVQLANPITIRKHYFIGFDINYSNSTDTFAVYTVPDRVLNTKNFAFAKIDGNWKPFYGIPQFGLSTSLLINANSCQNTLAIDNTIPITGAAKFEVLYPNLSASGYVLLRNTGEEEFGTIALYDMLGHKVYEQQRLLGSTPGVVSTAQFPQGVYFLTIETQHERQIIKILVKN